MRLAARRNLALSLLHDIGSMDVACSFCGASHWLPEKVGKTTSADPQFSTCCQRGYVQLPLLPQPPALLRSLLDERDRRSTEYHENIRQYNMALAFTSLGATEDRLVNRRGGWVFRIFGELYHLVGSLQPEDGQPPAFAQLYIYDSDAALRQRMNRNSNLRVDTMSDLQSMLLSHHHYAAQFRHASEILRDHPGGPDASVRLRVVPGQASSQYALLTR